MNRRLLTSHLRHLLNPATTPNPKPFSFPSSLQNPLCRQSKFLSWQLKPNRNLYLSTYKPSEFLLSTRSRWYFVQMGRLLTHGARLFCFSLQRRGGINQRPVHRFWSYQKMTPDSMVWYLIGANAAVHELWRIMNFPFMIKHFTISLDNFKNGRLYTIITSAFNHVGAIHFIINMLFLHSFGRPIARSFGPKFLMQLYLGGAIGGSIFFWVTHAFLDPYWGNGTRNAASTVADASVHALIFLCLFLPKNVVHVHPFALISGSTWAIFWFSDDLWRPWRRTIHKKGQKFRTTKLGGAFAGILVCARIRMLMR